MAHKIDSMQLEIVLLLLREELHLREIARKLGESHSTVLRKINWLIDRNVVGAKMQGKNKLYSLENNLECRAVVFMAENYKLSKLLGEYPELAVILGEVLGKVNSEMVVLFGSYAKFSADKGSDVDIFIERRDLKLKKKIEGLNSRLSVKFGIFDLDSLLVKEIIKNHVILKGVEEFYERSRFFE